MSGSTPATSATELAAKNEIRYPNESAAYRKARQELLAEEIELRRHIERVAEPCLVWTHPPPLRPCTAEGQDGVAKHPI
jgi:hypothetical protein